MLGGKKKDPQVGFRHRSEDGVLHDPVVAHESEATILEARGRGQIVPLSEVGQEKRQPLVFPTNSPDDRLDALEAAVQGLRADVDRVVRLVETRGTVTQLPPSSDAPAEDAGDADAEDAARRRRRK